MEFIYIISILVVALGFFHCRLNSIERKIECLKDRHQTLFHNLDKKDQEKFEILNMNIDFLKNQQIEILDSIKNCILNSYKFDNFLCGMGQIEEDKKQKKVREKKCL